MTKHFLVACGLVAATAWPAQAQQVKLQIANGQVTLDAQGATARQILAEWARVGGTKVVGGDKLPGGPLTLRMVNMPERQALDILLRSAAGFMAAPRSVASAAGASSYDRILILATTSAPAPGSSGGRASLPQPGNNAAMNGRIFPPRPPNMPQPQQQQQQADADEADEEEEDDEDQADAGAAQPVFTFPAPAGAVTGGAPPPVFVPMQNGNPAFAPPGTPGAVTAPVITLQPNANGQPTIYNFVPNADGTPTATRPPTSPSFGVFGAPSPGMVQPTPGVTTPGQVTQPTRPPGQ
jgi:hypothetical protein